MDNPVKPRTPAQVASTLHQQPSVPRNGQGIAGQGINFPTSSAKPDMDGHKPFPNMPSPEWDSVKANSQYLVLKEYLDKEAQRRSKPAMNISELLATLPEFGSSKFKTPEK